MVRDRVGEHLTQSDPFDMRTVEGVLFVECGHTRCGESDIKWCSQTFLDFRKDIEYATPTSDMRRWSVTTPQAVSDDPTEETLSIGLGNI